MGVFGVDKIFEEMTDRINIKILKYFSWEFVERLSESLLSGGVRR